MNSGYGFWALRLECGSRVSGEKVSHTPNEKVLAAVAILLSRFTELFREPGSL